MTDTATPEVDTRQFTPAEIAIAVAKRVARVGDFDENWSRAIVERGIELAEDGAFTITTEGGQTFHLAVVDAGSDDPAAIGALRAEAERIRAYAETTQYHQQQHAEAYRELVKLREQRDAALALIDGYDGAGELALLAKISNALGGAR